PRDAPGALCRRPGRRLPRSIGPAGGRLVGPPDRGRLRLRRLGLLLVPPHPAVLRLPPPEFGQPGARLGDLGGDPAEPGVEVGECALQVVGRVRAHPCILSRRGPHVYSLPVRPPPRRSTSRARGRLAKPTPCRSRLNHAGPGCARRRPGWWRAPGTPTATPPPSTCCVAPGVLCPGTPASAIPSPPPAGTARARS